ncbi:MAG: hypothetical protein KAS66_01310 [Candidatus Omnitrophica bacterium]|nr:hypothetical protein [Candidatus Omnitrophota bacterium]
MAWLGLWKYRRKITISNTDIDDTLLDFPVLVKISASSGTASDDITDIFTELGSDANRKKIAITTSDGTTQCYVEIELFDYASSLAWLWIRTPHIAAGVVTELYIYYDVARSDNTTYVGDTGDPAAQNVWDVHFKTVHHLRDATTSSVKDSTSNIHDGEKRGINAPDETTAQVGNGQNFDAANERIIIANHFDFDFSGAFTLEAIAKPVSAGSSSRLIYRYDYTSQAGYYLGQYGSKWQMYVFVGGLSNGILSDNAPTLNYEYIAGRRDASGDLELFIDGILQVDTAILSGAIDSTGDVLLGIDTSDNYEFIGKLDEIRISDVGRSVAWIKATRYSNWDGLVSYSAIETLSNSLSATLPMITATVAKGNMLFATLPAITSEMQGAGGGFIETTLPAITAESVGRTGTDANFFATLPAITSEIQGGHGGFLEAALPAITADIKGGAILEATLPAITASLEGDVEIAGDLIVSLPAITANLEGKVNVHGDLICSLPSITAELTGTMEVGGNLACTLPMITAELTGFQDISGDLVATLPMITALIEGTVGLADDDGDPIDADECGVVLRYSKVGY